MTEPERTELIGQVIKKTHQTQFRKKKFLKYVHTSLVLDNSILILF